MGIFGSGNVERGKDRSGVVDYSDSTQREFTETAKAWKEADAQADKIRGVGEYVRDHGKDW